MSHVLNLIPDRFRRRAIIRKALRRWVTVWAAVGVIGVALCAPAWWALRADRDRLADEEANCREVRRLAELQKRLNSRLQLAKQNEQKYSFAKESHIPLSVVGIFSRQARSLKGQVRIDELAYRESAEPAVGTDGKSRRRIAVSFAGFAKGDAVISALIASLRRTNHFAKVELRSTVRAGATNADGRRFQINCIMFIDSNLVVHSS